MRMIGCAWEGCMKCICKFNKAIFQHIGSYRLQSKAFLTVWGVFYATVHGQSLSILSKGNLRLIQMHSLTCLKLGEHWKSFTRTSKLELKLASLHLIKSTEGSWGKSWLLPLDLRFPFALVLAQNHSDLHTWRLRQKCDYIITEDFYRSWPWSSKMGTTTRWRGQKGPVTVIWRNVSSTWLMKCGAWLTRQVARLTKEAALTGLRAGSTRWSAGPMRWRAGPTRWGAGLMRWGAWLSRWVTWPKWGAWLTKRGVGLMRLSTWRLVGVRESSETVSASEQICYWPTSSDTT